MFVALSITTFLGSLLFLSQSTATWLLAASQLFLLLQEVKRGQITAVGGFLFMSFLFFGVRPVHLLLEHDIRLLTGLFKVSSDLLSRNIAMLWATGASLVFWLVAFAGWILHKQKLLNRLVRTTARPVYPLATRGIVATLVLYQFFSLPVMIFLSNMGRSITGSILGAYLYDMPMLLQAGHIFAIVVALERYLRRRTVTTLTVLVLAGALFLIFTWLMREVSMFRGFYLAGVMVAGIAVLTRLLKKVNLLWLIIPIVLGQPAFRQLGAERYKDNADLVEEGMIGSAYHSESLAESYWNFYDSGGDMNIFDTFVAATKAKPAYRPYILSWLYVPVHFIPRALWRGKPARGILQDVSFMRGAPYSPGIAGFFLLDGGLVWMLGCMGVLGYLLALADGYILTMNRGYLRCCLTGIAVVNAMFLTRFFLWQAFYQAFYAIVPCILLAWFWRRHAVSQATLTP